MHKKPLIVVSICSVILIVLTSLPNAVGDQIIQSSDQNAMNTVDDIVIEIRAGVNENTKGNYGLGFLICITNNLEINITGSIRIYWNFIKNKTIRFENGTFNLSAHSPEICVGHVDLLHFPFPILKLLVIVRVNEISKSVSRSGLEIGPLVFFSSMKL